MLYMRFYILLRLIYLLACILILPLVACSSGSSGSSSGDASILIRWVAPTEREDNSVLSMAEIAGYRIYYGVETGVYSGLIGIDDPTATEYLIEGIPSGKFFLVMTTIDTEGRESRWSTPELEASF
jgi:hypothetical protein